MRIEEMKLDPGPLLPNFPIREECLYLDHAAISPLPRPVSQAMLKAIQVRETSVGNLFEVHDTSIMACRHLGAEFIGCELEDISLVPSTSAGLSMLAEGLSWNKGDEIILGEAEFAANCAAWLHLEARGVRVRRFGQKDGRIDLEKLEAEFSPKTRLLAVSWVSFHSGWTAPLEEISNLCRKHKTILVVDAIQGLGILPMRMKKWGIDAVVAGGHKWLLGPEGCALMATSPELRRRLRPVMSGWKNVQLQGGTYFLHELRFFEDGRRFEAGSISTTTLAGLAAALDLLSTVGIENISARIEKLNRILTRILLAHGWQLISPGSGHSCSGIVAGRPKRSDLQEAQKRLQERHVLVAIREKNLRLSPHFYLTTGELEALDRILDKCGL